MSEKKKNTNDAGDLDDGHIDKLERALEKAQSQSRTYQLKVTTLTERVSGLQSEKSQLATEKKDAVDKLKMVLKDVQGQLLAQQSKMQELAKQLDDSNKRAAAAATKHLEMERLARKLRESREQITVYQKQADSFAKQLKLSEDRNKQKEEELKQLRDQDSSSSNSAMRLKALEEELQYQRETKQQWFLDEDERRREVSNAKEEISDLKQEVQDLREQARAAQDRCQTLQQTIKFKEEHGRDYNHENKQLQADLQRAQEKVIQLTRQLQDGVAELNSTHDTVNTLQREVTTLNEALREAQQRDQRSPSPAQNSVVVQTQERQIADLTQQLHNAALDRAEADRTVAELQTKLTKAEAEIKTINIKLGEQTDTEHRIAELQMELLRADEKVLHKMVELTKQGRESAERYKDGSPSSSTGDALSEAAVASFLEREEYSRKMDQLQAQYMEAQQQVLDLSKEVQRLKDKKTVQTPNTTYTIASPSSEILQLEEKISDLQHQLQRANAENNELSEQLEDYKKEILCLQEQLTVAIAEQFTQKMATEKTEDTEREKRERARDEIQLMDSRVRELQIERDRLKKAIGQIAETKDGLTTEQQQLEEHVKTLEHRKKEAEEALTKINADMTKYRAACVDLTEKYQVLVGNVSKAQAEHEQLVKNKADANSDIHALHEKKAKVEKEFQQLQADRDRSAAELHQIAEDKKDIKDKKYLELDQKHHALETEFDLLQEERDKLAKELAQLKCLLQGEKYSSSKTMCELIAEQQQEVEMLKRQLKDVEDEHQQQEQFHEQNEAMRKSLIDECDSRMREMEAQHKSLEDSLKEKLDKVTHQNEQLEKAIVEYTRDLSQAEAVHKVNEEQLENELKTLTDEHTALRQKVVQYEQAMEKDQTKKRDAQDEISTLEQESETMKRKVTEYTKKMEEQHQKYRDVQQELADMTTENGKLKKAARENDMKFTQDKLAYDAIRRELDSITDENNRLKDSMQNNRMELDEVEHHLNQANDKVADLTSQLATNKGKEKELSDVQNKVDALAQQLQSKDMIHNQKDKELIDLQSQISTLKTQLENREASEKQKDKELQDMQTQMQSATQQLKDNTGALNKMNALQEKCTFLETTVDTITSQLAEATVTSGTYREKAAELERQLLEAHEKVHSSEAAVQLAVSQIQAAEQSAAKQVDEVQKQLHSRASILTATQSSMMALLQHYTAGLSNIDNDTNKKKELLTEQQNHLQELRNQLHDALIGKGSSPLEPSSISISPNSVTAHQDDTQFPQPDDIIKYNNEDLLEKLQQTEQELEYTKLLLVEKTQKEFLEKSKEQQKEREDHDANKDQILSMEKELNTKNQAIHKADIDVAAANKALQTVQQDLSTKEGQMQELNRELKELRTELNDKEAEINADHAVIVQLREQIEENSQEMATVLADLTACKAELEQLRQEAPDKDSMYTMDNLSSEIEQYKQELNEKENQMQNFATSVQQLQSRIDTMIHCAYAHGVEVGMYYAEAQRQNGTDTGSGSNPTDPSSETLQPPAIPPLLQEKQHLFTTLPQYGGGHQQHPQGDIMTNSTLGPTSASLPSPDDDYTAAVTSPHDHDKHSLLNRIYELEQQLLGIDDNVSVKGSMSKRGMGNPQVTTSSQTRITLPPITEGAPQSPTASSAGTGQPNISNTINLSSCNSTPPTTARHHTPHTSSKSHSTTMNVSSSLMMSTPPGGGGGSGGEGYSHSADNISHPVPKFYKQPTTPSYRERDHSTDYVHSPDHHDQQTPTRRLQAPTGGAKYSDRYSDSLKPSTTTDADSTDHYQLSTPPRRSNEAAYAITTTAAKVCKSIGNGISMFMQDTMNSTEQATHTNSSWLDGHPQQDHTQHTNTPIHQSSSHINIPTTTHNHDSIPFSFPASLAIASPAERAHQHQGQSPHHGSSHHGHVPGSPYSSNASPYQSQIPVSQLHNTRTPTPRQQAKDNAPPEFRKHHSKSPVRGRYHSPMAHQYPPPPGGKCGGSSSSTSSSSTATSGMTTKKEHNVYGHHGYQQQQQQQGQPTTTVGNNTNSSLMTSSTASNSSNPHTTTTYNVHHNTHSTHHHTTTMETGTTEDVLSRSSSSPHTTSGGMQPLSPSTAYPTSTPTYTTREIELSPRLHVSTSGSTTHMSQQRGRSTTPAGRLTSNNNSTTAALTPRQYGGDKSSSTSQHDSTRVWNVVNTPQANNNATPTTSTQPTVGGGATGSGAHTTTVPLGTTATLTVTIQHAGRNGNSPRQPPTRTSSSRDPLVQLSSK